MKNDFSIGCCFVGIIVVIVFGLWIVRILVPSITGNYELESMWFPKEIYSSKIGSSGYVLLYESDTNVGECELLVVAPRMFYSKIVFYIRREIPIKHSLNIHFNNREQAKKTLEYMYSYPKENEVFYIGEDNETSIVYKQKRKSREYKLWREDDEIKKSKVKINSSDIKTLIDAL